MSSGVVNVDTNGVIKILLIKNYDAVFEVSLNFVSNWLLIAIEFERIAGGDISRGKKCLETFLGERKCRHQRRSQKGCLGSKIHLN